MRQQLQERDRILGGTVAVWEVLHHLEQDRYLDVRQAAEYLCLSVRTLRDLLHQVPHFRINRKILFRRSELDHWMESHREVSGALDDLVDSVIEDLGGL